MCATSVNTFFRALQTPKTESPAKAAGNYINSRQAKYAKRFLFVFTFGVFYGVAVLIEHVANVKPKIREFAEASCALHNAIVNGQPGQSIDIVTSSGQRLTFTEEAGGVRISDGNLEHDQVLAGKSFENILERICTDAGRYQDYYSGLVFAKPFSRLDMHFWPGSRGDDALIKRMQQELADIDPFSRTDYIDIFWAKFREIVGVPLQEDEQTYVSALETNGANNGGVTHNAIIMHLAKCLGRAFPE